MCDCHNPIFTKILDPPLKLVANLVMREGSKKEDEDWGAQGKGRGGYRGRGQGIYYAWKQDR